jgi:hypothetical protein
MNVPNGLVRLIKGGCTIEKNDMDYVNGFQLVYKFDNDYGASVVKHDFSYGGKKGLYEVAVLDNEGDLCYTTPITDNVLGYQNIGQVEQILVEISYL